VAALDPASATIDGEAVWCDGEGLAIFDKHSRAHVGEVPRYAFDLLELQGEDWLPRPLEGDGAAIFAHACKLGAEGIVSKHREPPYRAAPSKAWLKTKNPAAPGMLRFREEA
jgi:ATP-dependent DNA ligase